VQYLLLPTAGRLHLFLVVFDMAAHLGGFAFLALTFAFGIFPLF